MVRKDKQMRVDIDFGNMIDEFGDLIAKEYGINRKKIGSSFITKKLYESLRERKTRIRL